MLAKILEIFKINLQQLLHKAIIAEKIIAIGIESIFTLLLNNSKQMIAETKAIKALIQKLFLGEEVSLLKLILKTFINSI